MAFSLTGFDRIEPCYCVSCDRCRVSLILTPSHNFSAQDSIAMSSIGEIRACIKSNGYEGKTGNELEQGSLGNSQESQTTSWKFHLPDRVMETKERSFTLVVQTGAESGLMSGKGITQPSKRWWSSLFRSSQYFPLASTHRSFDDYGCEQKGVFKSRHNPLTLKKTMVTILVAAAIMALIVIFTLSSSATLGSSKWPEEGYVRFPTHGSDGPKRQLRILYHNATEWSRNNPHDQGQWRIRIDYQALIPIDAWDEDEDRYQKWFHDRYDVMHEAVVTRSYIRPSWLGSLNISVPWDNEFHLAHCIVTMKRYWKAKETGKHVCPRDISPTHIQHCLNWLDGIVFKPEPGLPDMGPAMAWQTKVCY